MRAPSAFRGDARGATAIEYGLIAALICVAILGALTLTGKSVGEQWDSWTKPIIASLKG